MKNIYMQNLEKRFERLKSEKLNYYNSMQQEIKKIKNIVKLYNLKKAVLFGSILNYEYFNTNSDLDIGIIGLNKSYFFKLYRELSLHLNIQFDLIDLDDDDQFKQKIFQNCEVIYE